MNEHTDAAFKPMDEANKEGGRGPRSDGTVEYKIVEGDTFIDGKLVPKEVIGYTQSEPDPQ